MGPGRPRTPRRATARPESPKCGRPAPGGPSASGAAIYCLAQPEGWDQHVAVTPEIGMRSAVAHDLGADELVAIEGGVDDKLAGVPAENAAVSDTNDFRAALEDPLVGVEAVRV